MKEVKSINDHPVSASTQVMKVGKSGTQILKQPKPSKCCSQISGLGDCCETVGHFFSRGGNIVPQRANGADLGSGLEYIECWRLLLSNENALGLVSSCEM